MYPLYEDLREKLGDPLWVDENGVPRYKPFAPGMLDIYAKFAALVEIRCQACRRPFLVGVSWSIIKCIGSGELVHWNEEGHDGRPMVMPSVEEGPGAFGFGDAPWHETPDEGVCWRDHEHRGRARAGVLGAFRSAQGREVHGVGPPPGV